MIKSGKELLLTASQSGLSRTKQSPLATAGLTFLAGAYIALGAFLAVRAGLALPWEIWGGMGKLIFASVFPVGLMLVVICGADLFTGNCMTLTLARHDQKITFSQSLCSGFYSWIGNFVGAIFVAYVLVYSSGLIFETTNGGTMPWAEGIVKLANSKTNLSFWEAFIRAVGCNWLVCLAVYSAYSANTTSGKIIALWIPTMAFVAMGFEHCIANMFFIPLGIWTGTAANYTALVEAHQAVALTANWNSFFLDNLLPVTLGNIVGGAIMVAGIYAMIYGKNRY